MRLPRSMDLCLVSRDTLRRALEVDTRLHKGRKHYRICCCLLSMQGCMSLHMALVKITTPTCGAVSHIDATAQGYDSSSMLCN